MPGKHQHFQEPGVGCCGKYFLFGFNIVFWVSAGWVSGPAPGVTGGGPVSYRGETTPCPRAEDALPTPSCRPTPGTGGGSCGEAQIAGGGPSLRRRVWGPGVIKARGEGAGHAWSECPFLLPSSLRYPGVWGAR